MDQRFSSRENDVESAFSPRSSSSLERKLHSSGIYSALAVLAVSIVALILSFVTLTVQTWWMFAITMSVAFLGIGIDAYSLGSVDGTKGPTGVMNAVSLTGDVASLAISLVENHDHL